MSKNESVEESEGFASRYRPSIGDSLSSIADGVPNDLSPGAINAAALYN